MYPCLKLHILLPMGVLVFGIVLLLSSALQASALPHPAAYPLPQPTVPTPPAPITLSIARSGNAAQLSWTDHFTNWTYEVHRSIIPFFTPTGSTLLATLPADTRNFSDGTSGIGNVGINHYYRVAAVNGATKAYSHWVGEMDYALNTTAGSYSLVGIPFASPAPNDAAMLATQLGNVNTVLGWSMGTQTFKTYTPNTGNFNLAFGDAIFVQVGSGAASSVNIVGKLSTAALTVKPGGYTFLTQPLYCDELPNASSVASDMGNVTNLLRWLQNTQSFQAFTPPNIGDFAIAVGAPFILELNSSGPTSWPGLFTTCQ